MFCIQLCFSFVIECVDFMLMLIMYDLVLISLSLQDGVIKTLQRFEEQGKLHFPSGEDM